MIFFNIFGALISLVVMVRGAQDDSPTFTILGAGFLALNVYLLSGNLS